MEQFRSNIRNQKSNLHCRRVRFAGCEYEFIIDSVETSEGFPKFSARASCERSPRSALGDASTIRDRFGS